MIDTGQPMHAYDADQLGYPILVKHSTHGHFPTPPHRNEYKLQDNLTQVNTQNIRMQLISSRHKKTTYLLQW